MRRIVERIVMTVALILLWFGSAYFAAGVIASSWAWTGGLINAALGVVALMLVTRTEHGRKLFYEGPSNGGSLIIGLMWLFPGILFFWGAVGWLLRLWGFWKF